MFVRQLYKADLALLLSLQLSGPRLSNQLLVPTNQNVIDQPED
jgi:hypothetical protein